jgi:hypothetical protein
MDTKLNVISSELWRNILTLTVIFTISLQTPTSTRCSLFLTKDIFTDQRLRKALQNEPDYSAIFACFSLHPEVNCTAKKRNGVWKSRRMGGQEESTRFSYNVRHLFSRNVF